MRPPENAVPYGDHVEVEGADGFQRSLRLAPVEHEDVGIVFFRFRHDDGEVVFIVKEAV